MKGATAKENIKNKIIAALGADYVGEFDKKLYMWADDGGERIQVCISMTCPKVFKGAEPAPKATLDFDDESDFPAAAKPVDITPEEKETLQELMNRLGL